MVTCTTPEKTDFFWLQASARCRKVPGRVRRRCARTTVAAAHPTTLPTSPMPMAQGRATNTAHAHDLIKAQGSRSGSRAVTKRHKRAPQSKRRQTATTTATARGDPPPTCHRWASPCWRRYRRGQGSTAAKRPAARLTLGVSEKRKSQGDKVGRETEHGRIRRGRGRAPALARPRSGC